MIDDPMTREYQSKLADLLRQRADMETMYTPDYVKVRQVDAQIAAVRAALDTERSAIQMHAKDEYQEAARRERLLAMNYDTQGRSINREAEKAIQYSILKREVDSNQQLYDAMLQRTKLVSAAAALRTTNVRILDSAAVPTAPYKPRPAVNAILGCLSGLLLGAVLIIARDRAAHTLQERGDVNTYLNLPELGVIPLATRGWTQHGTSYDLTVAESFRGALTSILFSSRYGTRSHSQMLVLTSWSPGEGKSTTVSNLGVALAEIGRRVLIINVREWQGTTLLYSAVECVTAAGCILLGVAFHSDLIALAALGFGSCLVSLATMNRFFRAGYTGAARVARQAFPLLWPLLLCVVLAGWPLGGRGLPPLLLRVLAFSLVYLMALWKLRHFVKP